MLQGLGEKKKENKVRERRRKDCTEKRVREKERDEKWCEDKTQYVDSSKPYK